MVFFLGQCISACENWKCQWMVMNEAVRPFKWEIMAKTSLWNPLWVGEFHSLRLRRLMSQWIIKNRRIKGLAWQQTPLACYENSNWHFLFYPAHAEIPTVYSQFACVRCFLSFTVGRPLAPLSASSIVFFILVAQTYGIMSFKRLALKC